MIKPQLWVWIGSPDDKMDVLRYVRATEDDVLAQPCVEEVCASIQARWSEKAQKIETERDCALAIIERVRGMCELHRTDVSGSCPTPYDTGRATVYNDILAILDGETLEEADR